MTYVSDSNFSWQNCVAHSTINRKIGRSKTSKVAIYKTTILIF